MTLLSPLRSRLLGLLPAALLATAACTHVSSAQGGSTGQTAQGTSISFGDALRIAEQHRVSGLESRRFTHSELWGAMAPSLRSSALDVKEVGRSLHGREIRAVTFGNGPTTVLLWSQMHGDESTASMSLADIFSFLAGAEPHPMRERIARELTVVFVPMLNPDGAERFQRQNAAGVDVNRDARNLQTPEARTLKSLRDSIRPDFGFNLHDQNARTRAGRNGVQVGIALLAPAYNAERDYNDVRSRARLVASTMAAGLASEIPGRVARYDDTFNPRAFGDLMQTWGTSTVLIEAGALPDDPQKQRLRTLNAAAILVALDAIATGTYANASAATYDDLPQNTGGAMDVLIRGAQLVIPGQPPMKLDISVNYDDAVARTGGRVREVGDLQGVIAIDTLSLDGLYLHPDAEALVGTSGKHWLTIDAPAKFTVRRGESPTSEVVRRIDR
jgi:hypothetical protein